MRIIMVIPIAIIMLLPEDATDDADDHRRHHIGLGTVSAVLYPGQGHRAALRVWTIFL
jgi:hypothetical protein